MLLFVITSITNLYANYNQNKLLEFVSKPLLMVTLGMSLWSNHNRLKLITILVSSMIGDIMMMIDLLEPAIISFSITHLQYIWFYLDLNNLSLESVYQTGLLLILLIGVVNRQIGDQNRLRVNLIRSYITILGTLLIAAHSNSTHIQYGVKMFILSDAMIGLQLCRLNPFSQIIYLYNTVIMATYILAQSILIYPIAHPFNQTTSLKLSE